MKYNDLWIHCVVDVQENNISGTNYTWSTDLTT